MKEKKTRDTVTLAVSVALAMVLSYIEFLLPPIYAPLPAVKCGLANVAVVFVLYRLGNARAAAVAGVKVALTALLFGSFVSLAYSVSGAILSLAVMIALKRVKCFSAVGVSIAGGVAHNIGQIAVAVALLGRAELALYLPVLALSGTAAGIIVGLCGGVALNRIKEI